MYLIKMKGLKYIIAFVILTTSSAYGQKRFEITPNVNAGYEHNIYKAPKRLYDKTKGEYRSEDSTRLNDFFVEGGYDVSFSKKKRKKYKYGLNHSVWTRQYFTQTQISQYDADLKLNYLRYLNKKLSIGTSYLVGNTNKIASALIGEGFTRNFIYLTNRAELLSYYRQNKKTLWHLSTSFENKKYHKEFQTISRTDKLNLAFDEENTGASFSHNNLTGKLSFKRNINKRQKLAISGTFVYRNYLDYLAKDSLGSQLKTNPLRTYHYYTFGGNYKIRIKKRSILKPYITLIRRNDLYQDYYSFSSLQTGFRYYFRYKKLKIATNLRFEKVNFDVRQAPVFSKEFTALRYNYFSSSISASYKLKKRWYLSGSFSSSMRTSNGELEDWVIRRPYNYFETAVGAKYVFIKSSKKKKKRKKKKRKKKKK
tara:strand:- start:2474 stop:3745 length:1272 start_codon:yes stop_codon:yes gene_type:complete